MSPTPTTDIKSGGSLLFIKEVAKYFMDFLESDFHKHKLPRRSIKLRNDNNLLVGLNLQKYPSFNTLVRKAVCKVFDQKALRSVVKGVHKTNIPKNLIELIKLQVGKVEDSQIRSIVERIAEEIKKAGTLHEKEYDVALVASIEGATKIIRETLVHPFVESVEKTIQNLSLGDEDDVYLVEEELSDVFLRLLESKISEVLNLYIAKEKVSVAGELRLVFEPQDIRNNLVLFFENLQVADLFSELFEIDRNKSILDKQDFYLYFGDISFRGTKYPIFYIPFVLHRISDALEIEFDSRAYINKKVLEYIVQEYNVEKGTRGGLKTVSERIIYLSQHQEDFCQILDSVLGELCHFFELNGQVDFSDDAPSNAKGASVRISDSCYICLFDKSDEALVNDYEEILQQLNQNGGELATIFNKLIEAFIHQNPKPFNPEVEDEWDNTEVTDRLVYSSPIPLNSEQRQILSAVRRNDCRYIIVEGPPGTGKSHTITAILFDAILKNKSTLVLSDKKEALDVVEDKIIQTMNKVRYDENFQNPILRLGNTGNTYNSILSRGAIEGIKTHHRAVKKDYETIEETITRSANSLREDLEAEILAYENIDIKEIHEYFDLELYFRDKELIFEIEELNKKEGSVIGLGDFRNSLIRLKDALSSNEVNQTVELLKIKPDTIQSIDDCGKFTHFLELALEGSENLRATFSGKLSSILGFSRFSSGDLVKLRDFIEKYEQLRNWLFGYLFSKRQIEELDINFKQSFIHSKIEKPHEAIQQLKNVCEIYDFADKLGGEIDKTGIGDSDFIALTHRLLIDEDFVLAIRDVVALDEDIACIDAFARECPKTTQLAGINTEKLHSILKNRILETPESEFDKQLRYLELGQKIKGDFSGIQELNYAARMKQIEDLVTIQATHLLDGRLIDFYTNNYGDASALRSIIKNKERFPKNEFSKLKEAFPCILAGIRDYAEYIPLEQEIFDLVIIDEASQVSIAQAFPALLRAKKVLILGDKKQFSNVKAAQARSITNQEYLGGLDASFKENVSREAIQLVRLKKFNIKTSILEFFEFISNYSIQLLKYFRGYKEIISYSNKYFYQGGLQVMKIRGKPIDEVIKFKHLNTEDSDELYPNTNKKEAEFILTELKKLKEDGRSSSVGIITPHTNQQKLLVEMISKVPEFDYFLNTLHLKIMTFDTCQGEERDIIYYSMVASPHSDKLWGVFIKELSNVDIEEDGQIKAQRLNVGFSRARECMYFILSKRLEDYGGSVGEALRHYKNILDEAKKEHTTSEVDKRSRMEPEVMNWFYQTKFWLRHKDSNCIEFIPQFEIGKYLKQLDRSYSHPEYKVDFLLVYTDERHKEYKIIIEYDGFKEHFREIDEVNEFNYQSYFSEKDIYRQTILEGYGYKFLRINRFNVGENPIATLDDRIGKLIKSAENNNPLLTSIHNTVEGLHNGAMLECPRCKTVKPREDFEDESLITGYGRFCAECKRTRNTSSRTGKSEPLLIDKTHSRRNAETVASAINNHLIINMRYKGVVRDIYPYAADGTYCVAYCTFRKSLRTFRIDRMQNLRVGDKFQFDGALQKSAQGKVGEAHTYHRSYSRY